MESPVATLVTDELDELDGLDVPVVDPARGDEPGAAVAGAEADAVAVGSAGSRALKLSTAAVPATVAVRTMGARRMGSRGRRSRGGGGTSGRRRRARRRGPGR